MKLFKTSYNCNFCKIAFQDIIDRLNRDYATEACNDEKYVAFVDGDSNDICNTLKNIYDQKKLGESIHVITLTSKGRESSSVIKQLSDFVVSKKMTSIELEGIVKAVLYSEPKVLTDDIFGDVWGVFFKSANKESRVLKLLIEGYSHAEIAKMLHLSVKTVSAYKIKVVKKHGAKNFNELYITKFSHKPLGL